jgi:hypothetical protein
VEGPAQGPQAAALDERNIGTGKLLLIKIGLRDLSAPMVSFTRIGWRRSSCCRSPRRRALCARCEKLRDGKIVRMREYLERHQALEAAGLRE